MFTERAPGALALASGYGCQWWLLVGLTVDHLGTPLVSIQQDAERLPEVICAEVRMPKNERAQQREGPLALVARDGYGPQVRPREPAICIAGVQRRNGGRGPDVDLG